MAHFWLRTGSARRRVYRFEKRRAWLGLVLIRRRLIRSDAWLTSEGMLEPGLES